MAQEGLLHQARNKDLRPVIFHVFNMHYIYSTKRVARVLAASFVSVVSIFNLTVAMAGDLRRSVVKVYGASAPGSGVVVRSDSTSSLILTAGHVIKDTHLADRPYVQTCDGDKWDIVQIRALGGLDLAELTINASLPAAPVRSTPHVGGPITLIGFPQGSPACVTSTGPSEAEGQSASFRPGGYALVHAAPSGVGFSGGGVFNQDSELVGIHGQADTGRLSSGRVIKTGYALAVPVSFWALMDPGTTVVNGTLKVQDMLARASFLRSASQLDQSLDVIDRALELDHSKESLHIFRSSLYLEMQKPELALADLNTVETLKSGAANVAIHVNRGNALMLLGNYHGALASYDAALALEARVADIHINRSKALQRLGRTDEALRSLDHVLSFNNRSLNVYVERARLLHDMKRNQEALSDLHIYVKARNDDPIAISLMGAIYADLLDNNKSYEYFSRAYELRPDDANFAINKAVALERLGENKAAIQILRDLNSARPGNSTAQANLSEMLFSIGRHGEACEMAKKATDNGFTWNSGSWSSHFLKACMIIPEY